MLVFYHENYQKQSKEISSKKHRIICTSEKYCRIVFLTANAATIQMNNSQEEVVTENPNTETSQVEGTVDASDAPKGRKRGNRGGNRIARTPRLKDWVRVIHSQTHGLPNKTVHLRLNEATGCVELITQAPKQEGSDELESPRTQVFMVTTFELINDPTANPLGIVAAAAASDAAPTEAVQAEGS